MNLKKYWIEKELFEIPHGADSIIYAPLKKAVLLCNKNMVNLLCDIAEGQAVDIQANRNDFNKLRRIGIIHNRPESINSKNKIFKNFDQPFLPINLTLFLTSDCNLSCRYCYAAGGEKRINMPVEMGLDAIDLLFLNAAKAKAKQVHLGFHGGGEPVLRLRTMKQLVQHARKLSRSRKVNLTLGLSTNAVMPKETAVWIAENIDQIQVSFDGPEDIQNYQRPMKNGKNSFRRVVRTLRTFEKKNKKYSIRGTITHFSQDRIPEIVNYFTNNFMMTGVHLEPMFFSDRATKTRIKGPDKEVFAKNFLKGVRIAEKKGINFYFSGYRFPKISKTFCGIGWKNFAVTPEGDVTSCFEVVSRVDPRSKVFFYGKYLPKKGFSIDQDKIIALRKLTEKEFDFCSNCFAKFQCAGDCRAKGLFLNEMQYFQGGGRCEIIQMLTKAELIRHLNLNEGY